MQAFATQPELATDFHAQANVAGDGPAFCV
jgi:hypothetical protein